LSSITAGPDGALWFTEGPSDVIGRVTTSGEFTEFATSGAAINHIDQLMGITVGPDKALWFTEAFSHRVGRITTKGIVTNEYTVSTSTTTGGPTSIAATNSAVWFIEPDTNSLGRIDVK
jgi:virginiamycin B lyase